MKYFLIPFLLCFSLVGISQNYMPFNSQVSKRFVDPINQNDDDYFFYATSDTIIGDSIIFDQYYTTQPGESDEFPECNFWGGGGDPKLDTTWLGNQIVYDQNTNILSLKNEQLQNLVFDFGVALNDSSLFYNADSVKYYIKFDALSFDDIYGQTDFVKHFKIHTYNQNGDSINTALTGFDILLAEDLGLISFIDCYYFPNILKAVSLRGQTNPLIGNYQLTYDDAYPWHTGDIVQYKGDIWSYDNFALKETYEKMTITSRVETIDSVWIYYESEINFVVVPDDLPEDELPSIYMPLPNPISYKKNELILKRPINYARRIEYPTGEFYSEDSTTTCNEYERLNFEPWFVFYCDSCRCYGWYDGFGTSIEFKSFVRTKGQTYLFSYGYGGPQGSEGNWFVNQIYSNINGVECGTEWVLGIDEKKKDLLEIFPNPSNGKFTLLLPFPSKSIYVTDLNGREVFRTNDLQIGSIIIDLELLKSGIYILHVLFDDELTRRKQIIIQ